MTQNKNDTLDTTLENHRTHIRTHCKKKLLSSYVDQSFGEHFRFPASDTSGLQLSVPVSAPAPLRDGVLPDLHVAGRFQHQEAPQRHELQGPPVGQGLPDLVLRSPWDLSFDSRSGASREQCLHRLLPDQLLDCFRGRPHGVQAHRTCARRVLLRPLWC